MSQFLFLPDPIDGYEFYPIPIQSKFGVIKIPNDEITDDFGINISEIVVSGRQMDVILEQTQSKFILNFSRVGKPTESDIRPMNYETKQDWSRIRKHIKNELE